MAILRKEETREEWRRRIFEEAEEFRRRHPVPDQAEVLAEMRRLRESLPQGLRTDSTELLREARGWSEISSEPVAGAHGTLIGDGVPEGGKEVAILRQDDSREELKRRILEEAREFHRRNPPDPDQKALLERILSERSYRPADHGAPDCTVLLREDRER
jgi:hypothetical protein